MVRVKICGITNGRDARAAVELGASALGFNFYEKSPRVVAPVNAWSIRKTLPSEVQAVGVFVDWKPTAVVALAQALQLSAVQLHGHEGPQHAGFCARKVAVIKAFRVGEEFSFTEMRRFRSAAHLLLDAAVPGQYGGTGHTANWDVARKVAERRQIFLAGGLTPENVAEAIRYVHPYGIDVASGVESRPGKKDRGKMREFFQEVERADRELRANGKAKRGAAAKS
jgi:phosphoribosylanthranilate isomerase